MDTLQDKIRGSLVCGAMGDALGYTVEFMRDSQIKRRYGKEGITKFDLENGPTAIISDDTQMTLFTANGLISAITAGRTNHIIDYVAQAYIDWYLTQSFDHGSGHNICTWLHALPALHNRRAPGTTCMSALMTMLAGSQPTNNSKGCGGIMRAAPVGLMEAAYNAFSKNIKSAEATPDEYTLWEMAELAGETARLTHQHPLGFLSASMLAYVVCRLMPLTVDEAKEQIYDITEDAIDMLDHIYTHKYTKDKNYLAAITRNAIRLAKECADDAEAISDLGEGWVGEEAWAVSIYCALRHIDDVEKALVAAVNHDGDSDSTGSVCGNIMGAIYGYKHLQEKNMLCPDSQNLEDILELHNVIIAIADDIAAAPTVNVNDPDNVWKQRYCLNQPTGL